MKIHLVVMKLNHLFSPHFFFANDLYMDSVMALVCNWRLESGGPGRAA